MNSAADRVEVGEHVVLGVAARLGYSLNVHFAGIWLTGYERATSPLIQAPRNTSAEYVRPIAP